MSDDAVPAVSCTVRGVVLPALVKGGLPDVFDVLLDDFDAVRVDRETLAAQMAALKNAREALIRMGYEACQFRDDCTRKTVWRFRRQNAAGQGAAKPYPAPAGSILVSDREPTRTDADGAGNVLAWNADTGQWSIRFWFDFPAHPEWPEAERAEILRRWPAWKPLSESNMKAEGLR